MTETFTYPTKPGETEICCPAMRIAVSVGWIQKGFMWKKFDPPRWIPWGFNLSGNGWCDKSVIHYCPWCGAHLASEEDV